MRRLTACLSRLTALARSCGICPRLSRRNCLVRGIMCGLQHGTLCSNQQGCRTTDSSLQDSIVQTPPPCRDVFREDAEKVQSIVPVAPFWVAGWNMSKECPGGFLWDIIYLLKPILSFRNDSQEMDRCSRSVEGNYRKMYTVSHFCADRKDCIWALLPWIPLFWGLWPGYLKDRFPVVDARGLNAQGPTFCVTRLGPFPGEAAPPRTPPFQPPGLTGLGKTREAALTHFPPGDPNGPPGLKTPLQGGSDNATLSADPVGSPRCVPLPWIPLVWSFWPGYLKACFPGLDARGLDAQGPPFLCHAFVPLSRGGCASSDPSFSVGRPRGLQGQVDWARPGRPRSRIFQLATQKGFHV